MGPEALLLCMWMLPILSTARVIGDMLDDAYDPTCLNYTSNNLVHVDCSDSDLTELPDGLNYEAQVLLLSNNNFASFPSQLEKFTNVVTMDLSSNKLNQLLPLYFKALRQLHTINLSNNNYEAWTKADYPLNLHELDLSKNKIFSIDEDAFENNPQIGLINLSENRIYDISPKIFSSMTNLNTIILSRNYLSEVPNFQSQSLRNVVLSSCQIVRINVDSLVGMNSLLQIDLSMNQLEELPDDLASNTLQEFYISFNELRYLTDKTFSSLPHLAVLDLRGNEFREVWPTTHFASNPFLREVYVKGNRWSCEGFSVNLLLTYEYFTRQPAKVSDPSSLICYSPANVAQLTWQQAYIKVWHPHEESMEIYTTIAMLVGVIIGVLLTSMVCRCLMTIRKTEPPRPPGTSTVNLNSTPQPRVESVIMRVPLHDEDLPPSYDEALLMPQLNSSFHSLPDFIDEEEAPSRRRRSRSIGDLTEYRPRRAARRTVEIHINE